MSNVLIRNVPDETIYELDRLATRAGMSREGYLRQQLQALAARGASGLPDPAQVAAELDELDRIAAEIGAEFPDARAKDAINVLRRPL